MRYTIKVILVLIPVIYITFFRKSFAFQENIIEAFDIILTEIHADPYPVIGLPESEYIEIFNRSNRDLILEGQRLVVGTKIINIPFCTINSGQYLILCPENKAALFNYQDNCLGISGFPVLRNSGQNISIINTEGNVICFALYEKSWYKDAFKAEGGWSLEIIDTNNPCSCFSNWTSSEDKSGGTPGRANSVINNNPDTNNPYPLRVSFINKTTISLIFNEPMSYNSINDPALYSIEESTINILNAKPVPPDYSVVELSLSGLIKPGIIYSLIIRNGPFDCIGNLLNITKFLPFTQPSTPEFNDVIINEILFDPLPDNPEFIEIFNRSGKCIDLSDLYLCNTEPGTAKPVQIFSTSYLLFSGNFIVITENKYEIINNYNCPFPDRIINVKSLPTLPDNEGILYMINRIETIIDEVHYSSKMHHQMLSSPEGISMERISSEVLSSDFSNWHSASASSGYASPGYRNTQSNNRNNSTLELELMPEIFSPDNDGYNDVLGINYNFLQNGFSGSVKVYDANGRLVKEILNNGIFGISGSFFWNGLNTNGELCSAGIYIIFIEAFNMEGKVNHYKKCCVLAY